MSEKYIIYRGVYYKEDITDIEYWIFKCSTHQSCYNIDFSSKATRETCFKIADFLHDKEWVEIKKEYTSAELIKKFPGLIDI